MYRVMWWNASGDAKLSQEMEEDEALAFKAGLSPQQTPTMILIMDDLQRAVLDARARTGDSTIGTCCKKGMYQVVRVTYPKGPSSLVTPMSDWLTKEDAVLFLGTL